MLYLAIHIEEIPGVHDIQTHKLITSQGWYNVITNRKWFASVTKMIQTNLHRWIEEIQSKHDMDLHGLPTANVKQKSTNKEQESDGSSSYLTACSSVFTFEEGSIDEPLDASRPVTQAWPPPLPILSTIDSMTQDGISDITREDYDRVTSDNAHLSREVQELCQQMALPHSQQQQTKPNLDSNSQLSNKNLNQVSITQVAAAVAQIQKENPQPPTKTNKWSATNITESPECGALMDESFDSTTMKS